jgi:methionine-rich copper-binding protein CopC
MNARRTTAWLMAATVAAALGIVVSAHAKLMRTEPKDGATVAAPKNISLTFNETVDLKMSKIDVAGPAGVVKLGTVHAMTPKSIMAPVDGTLGAGAYSVDWQTAGDDGHVQKGKFAFTVK